MNPRLEAIRDTIEPDQALACLNTQRTLHFKLSDEKEYSLQPFANINTTVTSVKLKALPEEKKPDISIIEEDYVPVSFLWRTTAENIDKAVATGIIKPEALTGKVRYALGAYHLKKLDRAYNEGIISDKDKIKLALVEITQERVKVWESLERIINRYNHFDEAFRRGKMDAAFRKSIRELKAITIPPELVGMGYEEQIEEDILVCNRRRGREASIDILLPTGETSLMTMIKERLIYTVRFSQRVNQNITFHARSLSRGFFHTACERAITEINDHYADPYNPILFEHQGHYDPVTHTWFHEFPIKGSTDEVLRKTLMGICYVEEVDQATILFETAYTNWSSHRKFSDLMKRGLAWIFNLASALVGGVIDVFLGFFSGLLGEEFPSLPNQMKIQTENSLHSDTTYGALRQKINLPPTSKGWMFGMLIWEGINRGSELLFDIGRGVGNYFGEKIHSFYSLEMEDITDLEEFNIQLDAELRALVHQMEKKKEKLIELKKVSEPKTPLLGKFSLPSYHLNSGLWNDPCSLGFKGVKIVIETGVTQPLMNQPGSNLIFYLIFGLDFSLVLSTNAWSFPLMHHYINYMADKLAHAPNTAAKMAIALAPAHGTYEAVNLMVEGRSYVINYLERPEKDASFLLPWVKTLSPQDPQFLENLFAHFNEDPLTATLQPAFMTPNMGPARILVEDVVTGAAVIAKKTALERSVRDESAMDLTVLEDEEYKSSPHQEFLEKMETYREVLPFLHLKTKEELLMFAEKNYFKDRPEIITALKAKLYPEGPRSHVATFLLNFFHYLLSTLWCFLGPFYHAWHGKPLLDPIKDWWHQTKTIMAHAFNLIGWMTHLVGTVIGVVGRCIADVIVNHIFARAEALVSKPKSSLPLSALSYTVSAESHSTYEWLRQYFSKPIDHMRKSNQTLMPALSQVALQDKKLSIRTHSLFSSAMPPKRRILDGKNTGETPKIGLL